MTAHAEAAESMRRLVAEDAVGQLRRRAGQMAALGSEDGALKLDWVEAVARLLADPAALEAVEDEARVICARGVRHIIWAGMGGSVLTVRVLRDLGFCSGAESDGPEAIPIYPLDSTDPAALNEIIRTLAGVKGLALPGERGDRDDAAMTAFLRDLLGDVLMIGVAMGMTSEEPITHLAWFTGLLEAAGLPPADHLLVMSLPGSYLDRFARQHSAPSRPLQLDGGSGTGGRMSAPGTRVFLLPAALYLTRDPAASGQLRRVLQRAWVLYDLDMATSSPPEHPFARLAAALCAASRSGACQMLARMPPGWGSLVAWLEQLMEESLGKGGKCVVVFEQQTLNEAAPDFDAAGTLRVDVIADDTMIVPDGFAFTLAQPALASSEPRERLAALAASFLGWQLTMALYGYLQGISFAGQPAVEHYKARARALRAANDPLAVVAGWSPAARAGRLTLLIPDGILPAEQAAGQTPASAFAQMLRSGAAERALGYLDVTINGEAPPGLWAVLDDHGRRIANTLLGVPLKLRQAPAAYHSTEQSEMDGPRNLVSLRLVARETESSLLGSYTPRFLHAQAVSTWQAMLEAGRRCGLLVVDGSLADARGPLAAFFAEVEAILPDG
jgi:hypothetical protein